MECGVFQRLENPVSFFPMFGKTTGCRNFRLPILGKISALAPRSAVPRRPARSATALQAGVASNGWKKYWVEAQPPCKVWEKE